MSQRRKKMNRKQRKKFHRAHAADKEAAGAQVREEQELKSAKDLFVVERKVKKAAPRSPSTLPSQVHLNRNSSYNPEGDAERRSQEPLYVIPSDGERRAVRKITKRLLEREEAAEHRREANVTVWGQEVLPVGRKRRRHDLYKPSGRRAVPLPGHGESYHPSEEAHQDQMGKAAAFKLRQKRELKALRETMRVSQEMRKPGVYLDEGLDHVQAYLTALQEATPMPESAVELSSDSEEYELPQPYKPTKRKSKAERKRRKRHLQNMSNKERRKARNEAKRRDLAALKALCAKIGTGDEEDAPPTPKSTDDRILRLGRRKYKQRPVDAVVELPSALRTVDPSAVTNSFQDAFDRIQQRNMVPITVHHTKRTRKIKYKVKRRKEQELKATLKRKGITK